MAASTRVREAVAAALRTTPDPDRHEVTTCARLTRGVGTGLDMDQPVTGHGPAHARLSSVRATTANAPAPARLRRGKPAFALPLCGAISPSPAGSVARAGTRTTHSPCRSRARARSRRLGCRFSALSAAQACRARRCDRDRSRPARRRRRLARGLRLHALGGPSRGALDSRPQQRTIIGTSQRARSGRRPAGVSAGRPHLGRRHAGMRRHPSDARGYLDRENDVLRPHDG